MCFLILCLQSLTICPETMVLRTKETSVQTWMRHGGTGHREWQKRSFFFYRGIIVSLNIPKNDFTNSQASGISFYNCFGLNGAIENLVLLIQISILLTTFTQSHRQKKKNRHFYFHHSVRLTTLPFQSRGRSCHSVLSAPSCFSR